MDKEYQIRYRSWMSIIAYLAIFYLVASIALMVIAKVYSNNSGYEYQAIIEALNKGTDDLRLLKASSIINGAVSSITYTVLSITLVVLLFSCIKDDAINIKNNYKKIIPFAIFAAIVFAGFMHGLDELTKVLVKTSSQNQQDIEATFNYKEIAWTMGIMVVLGGPIAEELIFRKSIFNLCKKQHWIVGYLISTIAFALPHMVSTKNVGMADYLILCANYIVSGLGLAFIYKKSNENVFASILAHMANNIVALIVILC